MENLKYFIPILLIVSINIAWFSNDTEHNIVVSKELITNKEKIKFLKYPDLNSWYYCKTSIEIVKERSGIPFVYKSIDTLKFKKKEYFKTDCADCYD